MLIFSLSVILSDLPNTNTAATAEIFTACDGSSGGLASAEAKISIDVKAPTRNES